MDVLVLRALGIGDLLVAVPALHGLRRALPAARITLAAPAHLAPLAALTGAVDELLPTTGLGDPHGVRRDIRAPDLAVNLHGRGPESIADLVATAPARLLTHRHPAFPEQAGPRWREDVHEAHRWCDLLAWYGIPCEPDDLALRVPDLPSPAPGSVVVHPGAGYGARRWPVERFAEVAARLRADGYRVVATGSEAERGLAERVAPGAGNLAGRLDLAEVAALVAHAALVVAGDTGVAHLATAYGTASVVLFGPTAPHGWAPPPGRDQHTVLWAGETGDPFAAAPSAGLLRLSTADVLGAVRDAVQRLRIRSITAEVDRSGT